jgi:multidrug efflux pump subunit AcrA (membrane-fusion protein)
MKDKITFIKNWLLKTPLKEKFWGFKNLIIGLSLKKKIIFSVVLVTLGIGIWQLTIKLRTSKVTYETATATKGVLTVSTSGSGTITSGNYANITTKVSGTVKKVYVTNGDTVTKGQKIAEVTLDDYAEERQSSAWLSYLKSLEDVKQAKADKVTNDINMWKARQAVLDAQDAYDDMEDNDTNPATHEAYTDGERMIVIKTLDQTRNAFSVAESKYLDSDADIANAQTNIASALRDYQENSSTIVSPAAGTISDLALFEGLAVSANSSTSSTSGATIISSQTVGKINDPDGQLIATVNMSETDVLGIKANQKVVITLDAYSDMTFTGKVLAVNTSGSVSSSVTSYPVTILLDPVTVAIYPNMAINVEIITNTVADAIMVPSTAITTSNGTSTVQIMKNGKPVVTTVEIGAANDTHTQIKSGVSEGDTVVTSVITVDNSTIDDTSSLFSGTSTSTSKSSSKSSGSSQGGMPGGGMMGPGGM